jgi:hypothetical protein
MPATALFEMSVAAACCGNTASGASLQLSGLSIPAPLMLPPAARLSSAAVSVAMSALHGQLAVSSSAPLSGAAVPGATTHMQCTVGPATAVAPLHAAASVHLWLPRQHASPSVRALQAACSSLARLLGPCRQSAARTAAYSLHPALGDSCLHLGVLPAAQRAALCVRVPVAAEAYAAPADTHPARGGWAATMRPPEAPGTAITSACWVPGCGATSAMHLQGLATLPMPLPQVWPSAAGCVRRLRWLEHQCANNDGDARALRPMSRVLGCRPQLRAAALHPRKGACCTRSRHRQRAQELPASRRMNALFCTPPTYTPVGWTGPRKHA